MMMISVGSDQMPVDEMEAAQPTMATARANWMTRRASLDIHIPRGETWGGGAWAAWVILSR